MTLKPFIFPSYTRTFRSPSNRKRIMTFGKGLFRNDVSDEDIEKWIKEIEK